MKKFNIARMFKSVLIIAAVISYFVMLTFKPTISGIGALIFFGIVIFLNIKTKPEDNVPKEKAKEERLPESKFSNLSLEEIEKEIYMLEMHHYDKFSREKLKMDPLYQNLKERRKALLAIDDLAKEKQHLEILCNAKELMGTHDPFLSAYQVSPDSSIGNLPPAKEQELEELAQKIASKIIEQNHYDINNK